jgi:hypothetical protein
MRGGTEKILRKDVGEDGSGKNQKSRTPRPGPRYGRGRYSSVLSLSLKIEEREP